MKILILLICIFISNHSWAKPLVVGSKKFTESVIIGEILRLGLKHQGQEAEHRKELGGTRILWNALQSGDIDLYPEYSGTIEEEILRKKIKNLNEMRSLLKKQNIGMSAPLGFNNTYAVGMRKDVAAKLGIKNISDMAGHPELIIGWGSEFLERQDGWPGLRRIYQLSHKNVNGMDHDVGYRALMQGDIDVMDLYSTDAEILYYDLLTLTDDKNYFPDYSAVILYRLENESKVISLIENLKDSISNAKMTALNKAVKIDRINSTEVAAKFLEQNLGEEIFFKTISRTDRLIKRTFEHLQLVGVSLFFGIVAAIPLGILAARFTRLGKVILVLVSAIQTIPALALLVMMIKPLSMLGLSGIGNTPAFIALFLYSLLPIVRNTHAGLLQIPRGLQETATVLGLSERTRLFKIDLPLAMPSILAGIKTSLVLNIGFATLGALVGAGGYGQPILTGIRLDDYGMILEGAVPAAALALLAQIFFDIFEKYIISPGLRA